MEKGNLKKGGGKYDLKFPFTGEIWFDELNNYEFNLAEACSTKTGEG